MRIHLILLFSIVMLAAVGCSSSPMTADIPSVTPRLEEPTSPSKVALETPDPALPTLEVLPQMFETMPAPFSDEMNNLINKAKEHLAARLSISIEQVNFVRVYDVTWPDTSLGCPQEGMMYAQVLTPGYLIQLEHGSVQYEYHSRKNMQQVVTCENPSQPLPGNPDSF